MQYKKVSSYHKLKGVHIDNHFVNLLPGDLNVTHAVVDWAHFEVSSCQGLPCLPELYGIAAGQSDATRVVQQSGGLGMAIGSRAHMQMQAVNRRAWHR